MQVFDYKKMNEPIPPEEFAPMYGEELPFDPDPLLQGHDRRYLIVKDGADGQMPARWGMEGTKGVRSGGLN